MSKEDYYQTLGVANSATSDEIKSAYRKKAMKYHPDRNKGDKESEKQFKKVNEAYYILKDKEKRAQYDQFGHQAFEGNGGAGFKDFNFGSGFSDIFDEMFGDFGNEFGFSGRGKNQRKTSNDGSDLRYDMEVSLEDIYAGKKIIIHIPAKIQCDDCKGNGCSPGTSTETCQECEGYGTVRVSQGFFTIERTCPKCSGNGETISSPCSKCSGSGRVDKKKSLSVEIPAGVENGTKIRLSGEGEAGTKGGQTGDLYIFIIEKPHSIFKREYSNLYCIAPIPMTTAALGGSIEVPTLDGSIAKVKIPQGTQSGSKFRLSNKGMPEMNQSSKGDLYLEAFVETPVNLSTDQKKLIKKFEEEKNQNSTSPQSEGFFSKLKDLWSEKK